jgi:hypothetical protein
MITEITINDPIEVRFEESHPRPTITVIEYLPDGSHPAAEPKRVSYPASLFNRDPDAWMRTTENNVPER